MLQLIHKTLKHVLRFFVEIARVSCLPFLDPVGERLFDLLGLEGESTNLVVGFDLINLTLEGLELFKLGLVILKLRVFPVELLQVLIHVVVPEEGVLLEALLEPDHLVTGSLDRARQQQDHFNDLLVAGNPRIEWLPLLLSQVFLVPVLHLLRALQHG